MKILKVIWKDHHSNTGWHNINDIVEETMINTSVGYLVKKTDNVIILAQTYIPSITTCGELLTILRATITYTEELKSE